MDKNLSFYINILQSSVTFNKVVVSADISIQDFGGEARLAKCGEVAILFAKGNVGLLLGYGASCH